MGRTLVVLETGVYVSLSLQRSLYFRIDVSIKFQKPGKVFSPLASSKCPALGHLLVVSARSIAGMGHEHPHQFKGDLGAPVSFLDECTC
jgi:hypothetical protein